MSQVSSNVRIDSPDPVLAASEADRYWKFLQPSLEYGGVTYTAEELADDLAAGDVILIRCWIGDELTSLTAVRRRLVYGMKDLYVVATAGTLFRSWAKELGEVFDRLAVEADCDTITMQTRAGMDKLTKPYGYRLHQIILQKNMRTEQ